MEFESIGKIILCRQNAFADRCLQMEQLSSPKLPLSSKHTPPLHFGVHSQCMALIETSKSEEHINICGKSHILSSKRARLAFGIYLRQDDAGSEEEG